MGCYPIGGGGRKSPLFPRGRFVRDDEPTDAKTRLLAGSGRVVVKRKAAALTQRREKPRRRSYAWPSKRVVTEPFSKIS